MNGDGNILMNGTVQVAGNSYIYGLTEMENGKVAATGSFTGEINTPDGGSIQSRGQKDAYIAIFKGSQYENIRALQSIRGDVGYALAASGPYLYASGGFSNRILLTDMDTLASLPYKGDRDGYILKLDSTLAILAGNSLGGQNTDQIYNMTATDNSIYLVGSIQGVPDMSGDETTYPVISEGSNDAYVAKYDLDANLQWAQTFGSVGSDLASGIAVMQQDILVSGTFTNKLTIPYAKNAESERTIVRSDLTLGGSPFLARLRDCNIPKDLIFQDGKLSTPVAADSYEWITQGSPITILETNTSGEYTPTKDGYYAVRTTIGDCSSISEWVVIEKLGLASTPTHSLTTSPNPTTGIIRIQTEINQPIDCILTDISGKTLHTEASTSTLDISHLPAGIYYLTVRSDVGYATTKVVKY